MGVFIGFKVYYYDESCADGIWPIIVRMWFIVFGKKKKRQNGALPVYVTSIGMDK